MKSFTERPCPAAWRTSTHSTGAGSPACLQVALGQMVDNVFTVTPVATTGPAARRMPPAILPDRLVTKADTFDVADLARLTPEMLRPSAERLIVVGPAEVDDVRAAVERLGIRVIARVDRARIGSGRRGGSPWMSFSPDGGRPKVVEVRGQFKPMSPDSRQAVPEQLSEDVFSSSHPMLGDVNPGRVNGGGHLTNCVLAAIATDLTLEEQGDAGDGMGHFAAPPEMPWVRENLSRYRGRDPVEVAGYHAIVNAVLAAGVGARGIVVVSVGGRRFDHAFNVVHDDRNGVVFLDGQTGRQAELPAGFQSLQFLPTSHGFPRDTIAVSVVPGPRNDLLAGSGPEFERFWQVTLPTQNGAGVSSRRKRPLAEHPGLGIRIEVEQKLYFRGADGKFYLNQETAAGAGVHEGNWEVAAIIEDVAGPLQTLAEETGYPPVDPIFDETRRTEDELQLRVGRSGASPVPLGEIFRPGDGYVLTDLGRESSIGPPAIGEWGGVHVHHSHGVPLAGLAEVLDHVRAGSYPERATGAVNRDAMADGHRFGQDLAGEFVRWWADKEQRQLAPDLDANALAMRFSVVPKVRALWGVAALAYSHAASMANSHFTEGNVKRNFDVISRNELSDILDRLEPDVRDYLDSNNRYVLDSFREHYEARNPRWRDHYEDPNYSDPDDPMDGSREQVDILSLRLPLLDIETIEDYLCYALLQDFDTDIKHAEALKATTLRSLDDHLGALIVPQAVIEIRHFGAERVDVETARRQHKELAEMARREYAKVVEWESSPQQSAAHLEGLWRSVLPPQYDAHHGPGQVPPPLAGPPMDRLPSFGTGFGNVPAPWAVPPPSAMETPPVGGLPSFTSIFGDVPERRQAETAVRYGVQLAVGHSGLLDAVLESVALLGGDAPMMRRTAEEFARRQGRLDDPAQVAFALRLTIEIITPDGRVATLGGAGGPRVVIAQSRSGGYLASRPM
ncbi:toxin glutamine deamidase domain-containing protein [Actinomadura sp. DC4]|uniref:toxin glutamine deamidase domain-containing protein n=1 Tax=Actinomadura sp. DC4 TaxID=3055069 RepID=UPI0025B10FEA|nr:toxin glutamine deamidase domain-containing protein [Actinomadura sp. DC4]MDN3359680.1 toxin glutamine deamidase domain-containing protein [Actinomadura sp. DC4]